MPWPKSTKTARIRKGNLFAHDCPTRDILDDVTSRWGSLVLVLLLRSTYRFSELAYLIGGVSEKMLAQTLRALEADGFVLRTVYATKPPKVEYSLTPFGRELGERMEALTSFINKNVARVMAHRVKSAILDNRHKGLPATSGSTTQRDDTSRSDRSTRSGPVRQDSPHVLKPGSKAQSSAALPPSSHPSLSAFLPVAPPPGRNPAGSQSRYASAYTAPAPPG